MLAHLILKLRTLCLCLFPVCVYMWCAAKETWYWDSSNVTGMVLSGVKCRGDEMTLADCRHDRAVSCRRAGAQFSAGVICSDSEFTKMHLGLRYTCRCSLLFLIHYASCPVQSISPHCPLAVCSAGGLLTMHTGAHHTEERALIICCIEVSTT